MNTAKAVFRGIYQRGADKGDVYTVRTVVIYDWHHRDGGVHEGADGRRGKDNVRDGVVMEKRETTRPARKRKTDT